MSIVYSAFSPVIARLTGRGKAPEVDQAAAIVRFGGQDASHLVVLVHGLWGQPSHMHTIAESLERKHGEKVRILIASTNKFYNTYDGIEVGGERVAAEIEEEIASAKASGHPIKRFSILGYSLGGLIARYCVGLLYARGWFEAGKLEPVNFTTFASPLVGVPSSARFFGLNLWNILGARVLSTSGQQMFLADRFRQMGRPLLVVMADPSSIFMKALATFKNRALYSNIVNDRSVNFPTSCIVLQDPFTELERREWSFVPGYAPTILDINQPIISKPEEKTLYNAAVETFNRWLTRLPLIILFIVLLPVTGTAFFANAGIQTVRSGARIRTHEGAGTFDDFRMPLLLEQALEAATGEDTLDESEEAQMVTKTAVDPEQLKGPSLLKTDVQPLNLTKDQFEIIRNLNSLGWRKYPVHIQLVTHSHAAIIVRWKKDGFKEGLKVIDHWLQEEFEL